MAGPALCGQTEMGFEGDVIVLGADGTALDPNVKIKGFTVFGATQAAYPGSFAAPGNVVVNGVLAVSSGAYFVGNSTFTAAAKIFINDGSAGQILSKNTDGALQWTSAEAMGDNLGNHIATAALNMASFNLVGVSSVNFKSNVYLTSATAANYGGVYASTHVYVNGNINSTKIVVGTTTPTNSLDIRTLQWAANQSGGVTIATYDDHWRSGLNLKSDGGGVPRTSIDATNNVVGGSNEAITIDGNGDVGISTTNPVARLDVLAGGAAPTDMATIWRNSAGTIVSSVSATGVMMASRFVGDGSGLTGVSAAGDNLGNHNATTRLNMGSYAIWSSSDITAARYQINGSTVLAILQGAMSLAVGPDAGRNATGVYNTFVGPSAGYTNTTGQENVFVGGQTGYWNNGSYNAILGSQAGMSNTTGTRNSFLGYKAGYNNNSGRYNSFVGYYSGNSTTGENNSAVGHRAGLGLGGAASANTVFGSEAAANGGGTNSSSGTIVGYRAGSGLTTGSDNILLGFQAGEALTTGTRNIVIGYDQDASAAAANNELNIGGVLYGDLSAKTIGISTSVPQAALDVVSTGTAANIYAQIWRDASGVVVASMTSQGALYPQQGDNLGNHNATTRLNMGNYAVWSSSDITAARYQINGSTIVAVLPGTDSIAYGLYAGTSNVTGGDYNVFMGNYAGTSNTTGVDNTASGYAALYSNTDGDENAAYGKRALYSNTSGSWNAANGYAALYSNTVGTGNTANGPLSLFTNTSGANNTANGYYALYSNTVGGGNTANGVQALRNNTTASNNTATGYQALRSNTTGANNTASGYQALYTNTTGANNTANGIQALYFNDTGVNNTANGYQALNANTTGDNNTASGYMALGLNTTGGNNTANGYQALMFNDTGGNNTANGYQALNANTTGGNNTASGAQALFYNQTGSANAVLGFTAGGYGAGGANSFSSSTIVGSGAGYNLTTGGDNIFLGWQAGYSVTSGTGNIVIGYDEGTSAPTTNNELNIGGVLYGDISAKTIGIATRVPQAALDVVSTGTAQTQFAQIWRDSAGTIISSMSATGALMASRFVGDGSGLTGVSASGDNLGNHNATTRLNMGSYAVWSSSDITAARYQINGSTVLAQSGTESLGVGINAGRINSGSQNVFVGNSAGYLNTSGGSNSFIGHSAGYDNTGSGNSFFGVSAGRSNTSGANNTFAGLGSGYFTLTGAANVLVGNGAGYGVSGNSFSSSTLVGYRAGYGLTTGSDNIFLGWQAGYSVTDGMGNIVIGYNKDTSAPTANNELNIGGVLYGDLSANTIGISTRAPQAALDVVSTGTAANVYAQIWRNSSGAVVASMTATGVLYPSVSVAGDNLGSHNATTRLNMGNYAIWSSSDITAARYQINGSTIIAVLPGGHNIAFGVFAGTSTQASLGNIYLGDYAGTANTTGNYNTFVGYEAGKSHKTGDYNTYIGYAAGSDIDTGQNNAFLGSTTGSDNTTGNNNTFLGADAASYNTSGSNNAYLGYTAGFRTQKGSANAIVGSEAGYGVLNNSFSSSTLVGYRTGYGLSSGSDNIFVGFQAGYSVTSGTGNIIVGYNIGPSGATASNEINIGGVYKGLISSGTATIGKFTVQAANSGITLTSADFGKTITVNSASAQTVTLPSVTAADIGATVTIVKLGAGKVTIDAAASTYIADSTSGGTIYNSAVSPAYATITLRLVTATQWMLVGGEGAWITT